MATRSVSSSQGLTWSVTTDLATSRVLPAASFSAVFAALALLYSATRSCLILSVSAASSSSSEPNRSISSSSSASAAAVVVGTAGSAKGLKGAVPFGRVSNSDENDSMCLYHRAVWG